MNQQRFNAITFLINIIGSVAFMGALLIFCLTDKMLSVLPPNEQWAS